MVFLVVMYGCESWTIMKAEHGRIDYSLEEVMLKLKLQYFGHLMQRADSLEKSQLIGKEPDAGKD